MAVEKRLVTILVNGEPWSTSPALTTCGPEARVFTVRFTEEGTVVTFGDGVHGKPLPDGARISMTVASEAPLPVSLHRSPTEPTPDQALWTVIRKRTDATEFEFYAPCRDAQLDPDASRNVVHWRRAALLLGAALLALVLWCLSMRAA